MPRNILAAVCQILRAGLVDSPGGGGIVIRMRIPAVVVWRLRGCWSGLSRRRMGEGRPYSSWVT